MRWRLFEWSDVSWLPRVWRRLLLELMGEMLTPVYAGSWPMVAELLRREGLSRVIDLGAGSGRQWRKGWAVLSRERGSAVSLCLTDKYPGSAEWVQENEYISWCEDAVALDAVPPHWQGLRVAYSCLHHLSKEELRPCLLQMAKAGHPVVWVECSQRRWSSVLWMLCSFVLSFWVSWQIVPRRGVRLLWTYLLPVIPLMYLWDGVVSCGRAYRKEELMVLAEEMSNEDYAWEVKTKGDLYFLKGCKGRRL